MLCLSGFEPYSRWVPLPNHFVVGYRIFEVRTWLTLTAVVLEISRTLSASSNHG